jgi:hypothetical protein
MCDQGSLNLSPDDFKDNDFDHKWKVFEKRHSYAWGYFDFHAKQRTTVFNFFWIFAGVILGACASAIKDANMVLCGILGGLGVVITVCFAALDRRNEELVHVAEAVLESLENDVLFKNYRARIEWPKRRKWWGGWVKRSEQDVRLGILVGDAVKGTDGKGESKYAHGTWLPVLQWFMFCIFLGFLIFAVWRGTSSQNSTPGSTGTEIAHENQSRTF